LLCRNPPPFCSNFDVCRSRIPSNGSSRSRLGRIWKMRWPGESETYHSSFTLSSLPHWSLADLVVPLLADRHQCREILRHIGIPKWVLHFLRLPDSQGFQRAEGLQSRLAVITWNSA
jgi:hypothetical protein